MNEDSLGPGQTSTRPQFLKPRPNHARYPATLRRMSPAERLRKAFEISAFARALFRHGLRRRFPQLSEPELERLVRKRLLKCHNRNF